MSSYELQEARDNLNKIKSELYDYLLQSYSCRAEPEKTAKKTFKYLQTIVGTIFKRKAIEIKFSSGGSSAWYASILSRLSMWLQAEDRVSDILNDQLDDIIHQENPIPKKPPPGIGLDNKDTSGSEDSS